MKTAFAMRHLHFEDLGTLEPLLHDRGYRVQYIEAPLHDFATLDVQSPELLVVLDGPSAPMTMPCIRSSVRKWNSCASAWTAPDRC